MLLLWSAIKSILMGTNSSLKCCLNQQRAILRRSFLTSWLTYIPIKVQKFVKPRSLVFTGAAVKSTIVELSTLTNLDLSCLLCKSGMHSRGKKSSTASAEGGEDISSNNPAIQDIPYHTISGERYNLTWHYMRCQTEWHGYVSCQSYLLAPLIAQFH